VITVVIPALDEEGAVGQTVAGIRAALAEPNLEVLVVDDGSRDGTAREAEAAGARVVSHLQNQGYGRSLKHGIEVAQHDTIVICDADGTYPPEVLAGLVAEHRRGFDMVVGARQIVGYREGLFKSALRWLLKLLVEFTTGRRIPDVNSGLRVFSRATVRPYFRHLSDSFSFTTSITLAYLMNRRSVAYQPVPYLPRVGRSKVRLLRDSLRTLQFISQAILFYNPLKLFLVLAGIALAIGAGCLALGLALPWTAGPTLAVEALLLALLLVGLGFLADLVRMSVAERP
jgi:polyisoprenyl-phosphate glycosyltransferase